jgi:hypothetical protein
MYIRLLTAGFSCLFIPGENIQNEKARSTRGASL